MIARRRGLPVDAPAMSAPGGVGACGIIRGSLSDPDGSVMLDFFLSPAFAQQAAAKPNALMQFLPLIALAVLFYFMLIRPQMKRNKEHKQMLGSLTKGDEVVTSGGVAGKVSAITEAYVSVEIAEGVVVKVQKTAIASVLPKGTLKSL